MAVVQISKIQLRRGRKNAGSGLPQLSSGEMGWAIDSQELYIGNGSVSEGAPAVGNTKIITEHDSLFQLADSYVYKNLDGNIITGSDANNPVERSLQERLDDRVSVRSFGATGESSQDATVFLQRAIDNLFLNNTSSNLPQARVVLHIEPGEYNITDTLKLPPNCHIQGAGKDKTIIIQNANGRSVFETVSDESNINNYVYGGEYITQARNIELCDMTLRSNSSSVGLNLNSCRDSLFKNIKIEGTWSTGVSVPVDSSATNSIGLLLDSISGGVETQRVSFENLTIENYAYAVVSNKDINDVTIIDSFIEDCGYGVTFGKDMLIDGNVGAGTAYGPSNCTINNTHFKNISNQAIYIGEGVYNKSLYNKFETCGNNGGSDDMPYSSIIKFVKLGNESVGDYFSRTKVLSYTQGTFVTGSATLVEGLDIVTVSSTDNIFPGQLILKTSGTGEFQNNALIVTVTDIIDATTFRVNGFHDTSGPITFRVQSPIITNVVYIPEIEGPTSVEWGHEHTVVVRHGQNLTLFRLPQVIDQAFEIDYILTPIEGYNAVRSGKLELVVNSVEDAVNNTPNIILTDDHTFVGDEAFNENMTFDAILVDTDADSVYDTIVLKSNVDNPFPSNTRANFKFKVKAKQA